MSATLIACGQTTEDKIIPDGDGGIPDGDGGVSDNDQIPPDPGALGPLSFSSETYTLEIPTSPSATQIPLVTFLPQGTGPYPVIVFIHGFMLSPTNYTSYGEHLASWGFVTVMPEMPGGLLDAPNHTEMKEYLIAILDWLDESSTAPDSPLGVADPSILGLGGHSMGGKISLLASTEDERPLAVFGVDPVDAAGGPFGGDPELYPSVTPELMGQIQIPLGLLGETTNGTCAGSSCQPCAPRDENFQQYFNHAQSPALEIEILGANHMSFLDDPNCGLACSICPAGSDDQSITRMLTQRYLTAFFLVFLDDSPQYRHYLTGPGMEDDAAQGLATFQTENSF